MSRLTDREIIAICEAEVRSAEGSQGKEVSQQRAKAIDYYVGDFDEHFPVEEDRSSIVSRDVSDTVEWILPSLMRIFIDAENIVEFQPVSEDDEQAAEQESKTVRHIFFDQNPGFLNLYSFCKDALLEKTGIFQAWWEEPEWETESYQGLTPGQLQMLLNDPGVEYEITEVEQRIDEELGPVADISLKCARKAGKVCVGPVPPAEFGISSSAQSPDPKESDFLYRRRRMTASDLVQDGFSRKEIERLPFEGEIETEEGVAKSEVSGDLDLSESAHQSMKTVWVTECYIRVDRDDDGIAELLQVKMATSRTGTGSATKLSIEEVDSSYISAATPVMMTHRFFGQSIADLVMDVQEIRTSLLRGILDNTYLANNGRTAANERVNLEDLISSRPGGIVRTEGTDPPGNHLMPLAHTPVPAQTFGLLEVMDQLLKKRVGVGDEVMGLDSSALANVNTGVLAQAYDSARMRIEMIARILAEVGLKACFRDIHELARKHQDVPMQIKLGDAWQQVNPNEWRQRDDIKVKVGTGNHTRERTMIAMTDVAQMQASIMQSGGMGTLTDAGRIYNMLADRAKAHGLDPDRYYLDPARAQPQQPKPDPAAQLAAQKMQIEMQKLQIDRENAQLDRQIKIAELQSRQTESQLRAQVESMKAEMAFQRMAVDERSQVMNAETNAAETALRSQMDEMSLMLDKYKAELSSATALEQKMMEIDQRQSEELSKLAIELEKFRGDEIRDGLDRIERQEERLDADRRDPPAQGD